MTEWLAGALVLRAELSSGKPSVQWGTILLCALAAPPGTWSSSCSCSQALQADSRAGCARGRLLQGLDQAGDRDVLRHRPCSAAAGAPWPPQPVRSSPSVLSGDESGAVPRPGHKKWLQVKNLKPAASPEAASRVTSWDLGVLAGKGGKGKGDEMQIRGLVMWDEKRRFKGEMAALSLSGESRDANLQDIFPTKVGSFRASGVNLCYFYASLLCKLPWHLSASLSKWIIYFFPPAAITCLTLLLPISCLHHFHF